MLEKPKFQKMKFAGYTCVLFAAILTILVVSGFGEEARVSVTVSLIGTWLATGVGLVLGNAGKRIGGEIAASKITAPNSSGAEL